jgi:hypothetical protein
MKAEWIEVGDKIRLEDGTLLEKGDSFYKRGFIEISDTEHGHTYNYRDVDVVHLRVKHFGVRSHLPEGPSGRIHYFAPDTIYSESIEGRHDIITKIGLGGIYKDSRSV